MVGWVHGRKSRRENFCPSKLRYKYRLINLTNLKGPLFKVQKDLLKKLGYKKQTYFSMTITIKT